MKNTGTELVLLPAIEEISIESLPKQNREELALLTMTSGHALKVLIMEIIFAGFPGSGAVFCGYILSWILFFEPHTPIGLSIIFISLFVGFSYLFAFLLRNSIIPKMRDYQKMAIPPQLSTDAKSELLLADIAKSTNSCIVKWNSVVQNSEPEDLEGPHLRSLKNSRKMISERIAKIKKVAKHLAKAK